MARRVRPLRRHKVLRRKIRKTAQPRQHTPFFEWSLCAAVALVLVALVAGFFSARFSPVLQEVAGAEIQREIQLLVTQAVSEELLAQYSYETLIHLERDGEGKIAAMTTDMAKVNGLKNYVITQLNTQLEALPPQKISIPVGSLTNVAFFAGRGFGIPVQIQRSGTIYAELSHEFTDAGINQSRHQIWLKLRIPIKAVVSGTVWEETVSSAVLVGETVIVGSVPDTYLNMTTDSP